MRPGADAGVNTRCRNWTRRGVASAAALLIAGGLAAQPPKAPAAIAFATDVPLVESDGVPCINAIIGDGPELLFGIDTGNMNNVLDTGAAKAAGLAVSAIPPPTPPGYFRAIIPALRIGAVTLAGPHALVMDFAANQMPPNLAGTLAYTAFRDRVVQIDYAARRVRITAVLSAPAAMPSPSDHFSLITFGTKGPPIVVAQGFELNGRPVTAQVDSMYTGSLLVYTASIGRLGLGDLERTGVPEFFPLTDGGVNMKAAEAGSESFHGIPLDPAKPKVYFPTPGVHEPDGLFDATVGVALFRDAVLTLDFRDGMISVSRPGA
jgi:hypothetical protein